MDEELFPKDEHSEEPAEGVRIIGAEEAEKAFGFRRGVVSGTKAESRTATLDAGDARIRATVLAADKEGAADYVELKYLGPPAKK